MSSTTLKRAITPPPPQHQSVRPSPPPTIKPQQSRLDYLDLSSPAQALTKEIPTPTSLLSARGLPPSNPASPTLSNTHHNHRSNLAFLSLPFPIRRKIYTLALTLPLQLSVRQNRTPQTYTYTTAIKTNANTRTLLPGFSYALLAPTPNTDQKFSFHTQPPLLQLRNFTPSILCASKRIHAEASPLLYGHNVINLENLTPHSNPPANFNIPLFARRYARHVRHISLTAHALGELTWIATTGFHELKTAYPRLRRLTLLLLLDVWDMVQQGLLKKPGENRGEYVGRLRKWIKGGVFGKGKGSVPGWVGMRVVFGMEGFEEVFGREGKGDGKGKQKEGDEEVFEGEDQLEEFKDTVVETWGGFQRGEGSSK
ncbi:hypothetical protein K432DRAFT_425442 [Lepidopterella palustris CBS 459.81]|uniref:Uncharacterized protein n=1 Tax=Lepidopterella palustris CBS 459.81 TaxID=1314670 RepID=A0A8E2EBM7_9PEZI|nr:hypothetical protein K432DRAFT_425442 [Lepidopterella palustris CBS 459.81]